MTTGLGARAGLVVLALALTAVVAPPLHGQIRTQPMPAVEALPVKTALPDPLRFENGRGVASRRQWTMRRTEMKRILEYYMLGVAPPPPGNVTGRVVASRRVADNRVAFQQVRLSFGPQSRLGFDVAVFTPARRAGPFPTIVQPSFFPTPGTPPPPVPPAAGDATPEQIARRARGREMAERMAQPEHAVTLYADALSRGYAIVTFNYQQCGEDRKDYRDSGFFPAYPDHTWADLAAWAWCMSRVADYLQTQAFADRSKLLAVGHSRLGKATLVAGAFDDRFALVAPAGSGCGGTGAFRFNGEGRGGKEGLERATEVFPQWFVPGFRDFAWKVDRLPFDQHWLIALVAPRAFIAADALDDGATNGMALKQAYLGAKPVYEMLGKADRLGVHFRSGGHALAPEDWTAILDFADRHLRGRRSAQRFDRFPPDDRLH